MLVAIADHQRDTTKWSGKGKLNYTLIWAMASIILKPLAGLCATFLDDFAMGPKTAILERLYLISSVHL